MFSHKERLRAIQLFLKYDCSYAATIRELGYPSIGALRKWYKEYLESGELHQEHRKKSKYSEEQKRIAVNHYFEYGQCYARTIRMLGYPNRESLRQWCEELAPGARKLRKSAVKLTQDQKEAVLKLRLSNQEKTLLIDALRNQFTLKELLQQLQLPKSSYFYQKQALEKPDKYYKERQLIITIFNHNFCAYGYRRIHQALKNMGKKLSEKVVRRLMTEENLFVKFSRRKKYSSYAGEISPAHPNLLNRNFKAKKPNEKWLTDITEFRIPAGKIYLSPLVDCYDGAIVSWTIGTKPTCFTLCLKRVIHQIIQRAKVSLDD